MSAIGFEPSGETALNSRGKPARPAAILRIGDLLVSEGLATSAQVQSCPGHKPQPPCAAGAPDRSNVEVRTEPRTWTAAENGCAQKMDGRQKEQ
jgi:hypothetical protein